MAETTGKTSAHRVLEGEDREEGGPFRAPQDVDAVTGHLEGIDGEGRLLFREEGEASCVPVAIGVDLPDDTLVQAAKLGRRALVIRTSEPRPRLVLVGLVRERVSSAALDREGTPVEATVDGEMVRLTAETQIELKCGKARITLHKNGRIEVSGTYLLNRSRGPLKLKGATVEIN
jgi:hypothetical protein